MTRLLRAAAAVCAFALTACGSSSNTTSGGTPTPTASRPAANGCPSGRPPATVPGAPLDTILRVPAANRGRRVPLMVALHFATGSGAAMERNTGLTEEAQKAGFDVAYP